MDIKSEVNISLVQALIKANVELAHAEDALLKADSDAIKARKSLTEAENAVKGDIALAGILSTTGIRTLNDKMIKLNGTSITFSDYKDVPAIWEFTKNV